MPTTNESWEIQQCALHTPTFLCTPSLCCCLSLDESGTHVPCSRAMLKVLSRRLLVTAHSSSPPALSLATSCLLSLPRTARQPGDDKKLLFGTTLESVVCRLFVSPQCLPLHPPALSSATSSLFKVTTRNLYLANLESVVCHARSVCSASHLSTSSSVVVGDVRSSLSFFHTAGARQTSLLWARPRVAHTRSRIRFSVTRISTLPIFSLFFPIQLEIDSCHVTPVG